MSGLGIFECHRAVLGPVYSRYMEGILISFLSLHEYEKNSE